MLMDKPVSAAHHHQQTDGEKQQLINIHRQNVCPTQMHLLHVAG